MTLLVHSYILGERREGGREERGRERGRREEGGRRERDERGEREGEGSKMREERWRVRRKTNAKKKRETLTHKIHVFHKKKITP